ncbi:HAD-IA family hydrolase [Pseudoalteromonas fenneropenaei]|uniref:HAD-IA family hydrolase n=1 Tax=Pseudoalteromonas fenneropenaei TaxID=1737459 RepID=A0ABV7CF25_9GAMM
MRYQLVIFDWDGTVMDSVDKIVNCLQMAAVSCGVAIPSAEVAKSIIGLSLDIAVATLFPNEQEKWSALAEAYKHQHKEVDTTPTPLFADVRNTLTALKAAGIKLAVATGKNRAGLDRMLEKSATRAFFCTTRTADEAESKPHPQMLLDILAETGIAAADAVMVGDTKIDMQLARNAGIDAIGVTFGVDTADTLAAYQPVAIVDSYQQLAAVLQHKHVNAEVCQ